MKIFTVGIFIFFINYLIVNSLNKDTNTTNDIPLAHFIDWMKIPDDQTDAIMVDLVDAGVQNIVLHPEWARRDRMDGCYLKTIAAKLKKLAISSTACHGFWGNGHDLNCPDEDCRKQGVLDHIDFIKKSSDMGCLTYVLHPGYGHVAYSTQYLGGQLYKSLDGLLSVAERVGIKLAVENMIEYGLGAELASLATMYDHSALGLCFDSGHAHVGEGVVAAMQKMKPYIVTCHLHDNNGIDDQHLPPGYGSIDWTSLVTAIKACPRLINAETEAGYCTSISVADIWNLFEKAWLSNTL